jgi:uncharacterized membrane protein AbrB (regulator of aidB expression)
MDLPAKRTAFTLRATPTPIKWGVLLMVSLAFIVPLEMMRLPLTAYLATSPGGADSVAIIAASTHVDVPFVMAMQMARFMLVLIVGPALARSVARWTGS